MSASSLASGEEAAGDAILALATRLYPICRSITGDGVRETLSLIDEVVPLEVHEVPSGTQVFDWTVPAEWNVREAWIAAPDGERVVDFARHNLHLMSYSTPVRTRLKREALDEHLHSLPEQPDLVPYRTSYYAPRWGFCLAHSQRERLAEGEYEVCVDTTLSDDGSLTYAECFVPGECEAEVLLYTHTCHPSLANDNVAGMAVLAHLARRLRAAPRRLSYRIVFAPGTIGSITWLSRNVERLDRIRHGLVLGLLGDAGPLTYKRSRHGTHLVDRAAAHVLAHETPRGNVVDFDPYGYDERQFGSPGINLAVGRLTRSPHNAYSEYHTSADDLSLLDASRLGASLAACERILDVLEGEATYRNLAPMCEPQLGRRGLYRATGGSALPGRELAMLWALNLSDGHHSLLDIAERAGMPFSSVRAVADELEAGELLAPAD